MLDRITGVAAGWRGGSSASGFDVVEAGARVNPISRKRGDLVKKKKKKEKRRRLSVSYERWIMGGR